MVSIEVAARHWKTRTHPQSVGGMSERHLHTFDPLLFVYRATKQGRGRVSAAITCVPLYHILTRSSCTCKSLVYYILFRTFGAVILTGDMFQGRKEVLGQGEPCGISAIGFGAQRPTVITCNARTLLFVGRERVLCAISSQSDSAWCEIVWGKCEALL
jgi:hypothetical protein